MPLSEIYIGKYIYDLAFDFLQLSHAETTRVESSSISLEMIRYRLMTTERYTITSSRVREILGQPTFDTFECCFSVSLQVVRKRKTVTFIRVTIVTRSRVLREVFFF